MFQPVFFGRDCGLRIVHDLYVFASKPLHQQISSRLSGIMPIPVYILLMIAFIELMKSFMKQIPAYIRQIPWGISKIPVCI